MKQKNYRTFWILLGITVLSIPGLSYAIYNLMNNSFPKGKGGQSLFGSPFAFPDVWQNISWNSGWTFIIPAILVITLTTNEFTYKTHRQNIIDGWSRRQFIGVKLIELVLLSLLSTVVVLLTVLGFGLIGNKAPEGVSIWHGCRYLVFYFVQMLSYSMIAFLLAMLIKRAGLAIGAYLMYKLVEKIVVGISLGAYKSPAMNYLPEEVTNMLIPQSYIKGISDPARWEHQLPVYLLIAAVYLIVYCLVTGRRFLKSDL